jgi:hypothetical protein
MNVILGLLPQSGSSEMKEAQHSFSLKSSPQSLCLCQRLDLYTGVGTQSWGRFPFPSILFTGPPHTNRNSSGPVLKRIRRKRQLLESQAISSLIIPFLWVAWDYSNNCSKTATSAQYVPDASHKEKDIKGTYSVRHVNWAAGSLWSHRFIRLARPQSFSR